MGIIRTTPALSVVFEHTRAYRGAGIFWSNRMWHVYQAYYFVAGLALVGFALFNPIFAIALRFRQDDPWTSRSNLVPAHFISTNPDRWKIVDSGLNATTRLRPMA